MTLVSRLTSLKGRLSELNSRFGLPQYRDVVFRIKDQNILPNGLITENNTDILITPKPKVVNIVRTTTDNVGSNVYLQTSDYANSNDYKVTIVRTINIPAIEDVNYVILDPVFNVAGQVVGGIKCNLVYISDAKTIDWEVIIQRVADSGYTINPLNSVIGV